MANQILAGAVFHAGQVIAGVDANNPPYVGPPVGKWVTRSNTFPRSIFIRSVLDIDADPVTIENSTTSHFGGNAVSDPNGNYLAINDHVNDKVFIYDTQDLSAAPTVITPQPIDNGMFGHSMCMTNDKIFVGQNPVYAYDLSDLSAAPITISAPTSEVAAHGFGSDLACNSTHLFIGSKHARINQTGGVDTSGVNSESGKVHVWNLATEQFETDLYGIDPEYGDMFGSEIRVTDTHVAIGAYGADSSPGYQPETGAVYLFDAQDLSATPTKLTGGGYADGFGQTIDLNDTHLAVSESSNSDNQNENGKLFIYPLNNTSSPIVATGTLYSERFGSNPILFNDGSNRISFYRSFANLGQPASYFVYDINDLSTPLWQEEVVTERPILMMSPYVAPPTPLLAKWIVVGAPFDDDGGASSGTAFVFDATDPSASPTKIMASNAGQSQQFGESTAAFGDMIVVGATGANDNKGAVFVFDATDLSAEPTMLVASDGSVSDVFGCSVAVSDNYIVVGAKYDDPYGASSGSAYVFDANDLSAPHTKITANDGEYNDRFGGAVSVSGNFIVVGAQLEDDEGSSAGSVYVFTADNLSETPTKLTPSDLDAGHQFGTSVDTDGVTIVVGAPNSDNQSGAAYVFDASNLSSSPTKLTQGSGDPTDLDDLFGKYVSVDGDYIVIGATQNNSSGSNTGCVYVFDTNNLSAPPTELSAPDSVLQAKFGHSVSVYRDVITVGVNKDDHNGLTSTGAAYVFDASNLGTAPIKIVGDQDLGDCFGRSVSVG